MVDQSEINRERIKRQVHHMLYELENKPIQLSIDSKQIIKALFYEFMDNSFVRSARGISYGIMYGFPKSQFALDNIFLCFISVLCKFLLAISIIGFFLFMIDSDKFMLFLKEIR